MRQMQRPWGFCFNEPYSSDRAGRHVIRYLDGKKGYVSSAHLLHARWRHVIRYLDSKEKATSLELAHLLHARLRHVIRYSDERKGNVP